MENFFRRLFGAPKEPAFTLPEPDPTRGYSDDEVKTVALRLVHGRAFIPNRSWIGGTLEECDRADKAIAGLREEFANYQPVRVRRAVMDWLDWYEGEARKAREDVVTQRSRLELDAHREKMREENRRAAELEDRLRSPA